MEFSRQEFWSEWVAISFSGVLPDPETEPRSPELQADSLSSEPPGKPKEKLAWKKRNYSLEKGAKQAEKGFVNPEWGT